MSVRKGNDLFNRAMDNIKNNKEENTMMNTREDVRNMQDEFNFDLGGDEISFNDRNPYWYLDRTNGLEEVTASRQNLAIGVRDIRLFRPTPAQKQAGIIAKMTIYTITGGVRNISVMKSKFTPEGAEVDAYNLLLPSQEYKGEYYTNCWLDRRIVAQALSYVDAMRRVQLNRLASRK